MNKLTTADGKRVELGELVELHTYASGKFKLEFSGGTLECSSSDDAAKAVGLALHRETQDADS